jgi:DNA-binding CsgD family transcriptional regulator
MIGFSFIFFMILDRTAPGYLVVNTLMLGACGVYDLFWWSILGEMLEFDRNPAKVLGIGLSANVLGVLLGGLIGNAITAVDAQGINSSILALGVVCVTLIILPVLHKHLSVLLKDHAYLTVLSELTAEEQNRAANSFASFGQLTEREREITALLLKGKTYRMIAGELRLSENTVKTHIKNIYGKLKIQSRTELINLMMEGRSPDDMRSD